MSNKELHKWILNLMARLDVDDYHEHSLGCFNDNVNKSRDQMPE